MRPRDWFSVGVRLFGLWVFYRGFVDAILFVVDRMELISRSQVSRELDASQSRAGYYAIFAISQMALAYLLVFGAERLTGWAFKEPAESDGGEAE